MEGQAPLQSDPLSPKSPKDKVEDEFKSQNLPGRRQSSSSGLRRRSSTKKARVYSNNEPKPPWRKLLYVKQPYADNYTDSSFLSQLKRNTTVAKYSYWQLVDDFSQIVFYISCILIVILMFIGIYEKKWDPVVPTMTSTSILIPGFTALKYRASEGAVSSSISSIRSYVLIAVILLIASPILKSLTRSTSSDSIWAISSMLCIANTLFYEYSTGKVYRPIISTNISLSNAIVLASRLANTMEVFLFILFAIQVNILVPLFDASLRNTKRLTIFHHIVMVIVFSLASMWMWKLLNFKFLLYWLLSVIVIMLVMPAYFLSLQQYKDELQGPWDIARPKFSKDNPNY
ncbi:uncharacterized protein LODBEIA_P16790 [Lodderomyces beijingensis]|uniref:Phosphatidylinositol N-acetylglucosaminyltransferase n=1 Tax=Lodderomyces beijingensis TaxID=1775926 RepID=A0ABP0ZMG1_9ASCO